MKKLLYILMILPCIAFTQIQVIHFNAEWNSSNDVGWFDDLTDAKLKRIDIATNAQASADYKITVVPTILIVVDGEEEERYEADISFTMKATKEEVQEAIDEIVMDQF